MRHLANFLDKCLQVFVVLLYAFPVLFLGWEFILLVDHLGKERLTRATLKKLYPTHKQLHWGVEPYNLRYSLFRGGKISRQAHFIEWRPVTKRMWTYYAQGEGGK